MKHWLLMINNLALRQADVPAVSASVDVLILHQALSKISVKCNILLHDEVVTLRCQNGSAVQLDEFSREGVVVISLRSFSWEPHMP